MAEHQIKDLEPNLTEMSNTTCGLDKINDYDYVGSYDGIRWVQTTRISDDIRRQFADKDKVPDYKVMLVVD